MLGCQSLLDTDELVFDGATSSGTTGNGAQGSGGVSTTSSNGQGAGGSSTSGSGGSGAAASTSAGGATTSSSGSGGTGGCLYYMADGVCCDRACDLTCEACTVDLKGAGGKDGICDFVQNPKPDDTCPSVACNENRTAQIWQQCSGGGQCISVGREQPCPNGTSCFEGICQ